MDLLVPRDLSVPSVTLDLLAQLDFLERMDLLGHQDMLELQVNQD